jgi:hypothetical protein
MPPWPRSQNDVNRRRQCHSSLTPFLRQVVIEQLQIKQRFSSHAFNEVVEILDLIQRTPGQRSQYELRLKAQRDERARMQFAVEQASISIPRVGRCVVPQQCARSWNASFVSWQTPHSMTLG